MSGPERRQLPTRRPAIAEKFTWAPSRERADWRSIYIRVGFDPKDGAPLEIFLRPTKSSSRQGSTLHLYADDTGEQLSLLLQHGHTLDELAQRFKRGSLAREAVLAAQRIANEHDCRVPGAA